MPISREQIDERLRAELARPEAEYARTQLAGLLVVPSSTRIPWMYSDDGPFDAWIVGRSADGRVELVWCDQGLGAGCYMGSPGGQWKLIDNQIAETAPGGPDATDGTDGTVRRIRFNPVRSTETPQAIDDLSRLHRDATVASRSPLVVVPLAVLDFLCIHPFADGNGRVGRLLTVLLLQRANYIVGRYVSLDRIIEESKETYYEALERSSKGWHEGRHDARPWLRYFWGVVLRAYSEFEERVGVVDGGRGAKTARVLAAVARRIAPFSIAEIERECPGTSREMVRLVLRRLRDDGVIAPIGRGRGAKWAKRSADAPE